MNFKQGLFLGCFLLVSTIYQNKSTSMCVCFCVCIISVIHTIRYTHSLLNKMSIFKSIKLIFLSLNFKSIQMFHLNGHFKCIFVESFTGPCHFEHDWVYLLTMQFTYS